MILGGRNGPETIFFTRRNWCSKNFHLETLFSRILALFSQIDMTNSYPVSTVTSLATRFPQIELVSDTSLELLTREFTDFFSFTCITKIAMVQRNLVLGHFGGKSAKSKRCLESWGFPILQSWWLDFLSIPCFNADSEHGFLILRKIHTDQRSNLDQTTIVSLMSLKFNSDSSRVLHQV